MQEELAIALRPSERRCRHAENMPATEHGVAGEALDDGTMLRRITHHAALADVLPAGLELWLHERDDLAARRQRIEDGRQDLFQRNERHVDHGERRLITEEP